MLLLSPALAAEPLLSAPEVVELALRIEAGVLAREARLGGDPRGTPEEFRALEELGQQAWQRFVRANLRLVAMVAGQTALRTGLSEADLFQEGCLGLMTAIRRYDHRRGHFTTYALPWIRSFVGTASARRLGALNLPASRATQLRAARGVEVELQQRLGRAPSAAEVAQALDRPERWTASLLAHREPEPLNDLDLAAADAPPAGLAEADLVELLGLLPALEREVLGLRLGFTAAGACSLAATARQLRLSVARVRRLEEQGVERLRALCPDDPGQ